MKQACGEGLLSFMVLVTPLGLRMMYKLLATLDEKADLWVLYSNSVYYMQRLAHHCPWTLLVRNDDDDEDDDEEDLFIFI
jgi:hypothetical protein